MPGRRSIVSVSRCAPSLRASAAGIASLEKQPDVSAVARARSLQSRRQVQPATGFQNGLRILLPLRLVEVGRQEEAGFVPKQWVNAHDEVAPGVVVAGKVPANDLVRHRQEVLVRTSGAFDSGLLAQARSPIRCRKREHTRTCRSCDSRTAEDRRRLARERASETGRSSPRAERQMMDQPVGLVVATASRIRCRFNESSDDPLTRRKNDSYTPMWITIDGRHTRSPVATFQSIEFRREIVTPVEF